MLLCTSVEKLLLQRWHLKALLGLVSWIVVAQPDELVAEGRELGV